MKIAIVGATGFVGARLVQEALGRGHDVTAITRSPTKLPKASRLRAVSADVNDVSALTEAFKGSTPQFTPMRHLDPTARTHASNSKRKEPSPSSRR